VPARRLEIGLPDLVPTPDRETGSFCRRDEQNNLIVTICNHGTAAAGPSHTTVDSGSHGSFTLATPPLGVGACVDLKFPIPQGCFSPDCSFRIIADSADEVAESDEANNVVSGTCVG
jgi:hypothetical protein